MNRKLKKRMMEIRAEKNMKKALSEILENGKAQDTQLYNIEGKLVRARTLKKVIKKKGVWGLQ